ncbi:MAG: SLBB domain-containing protein [Fimbriimonadaceae bacterium]|jgi:polysaccharide export outer membrane protein|nr:SLBB domain-containing protein [Fimbriimonadaceae bacterium]
MMKAVLVWILAVFALLPILAQTPSTSLRVGDKVRVAVLQYPELSGEYVVAGDGTVSGVGFSRIKAEGRTLAAIQVDITREIARMIKDPVVYLYPVAQEPEFIFVAGITLKEGAGRLRFEQGIDIRRILSAVSLPERPERVEGLVYRKGELIHRFNVRTALLEERTSIGPFAADDVIVFTPIQTIKVWFSQGVNKQGETELEVGTNLAQGLAAAQGARAIPAGSEPAFAPILEKQQKVVVRRGDQTFEFRLLDQGALGEFKLESGDTVSVTGGKLVSFTVDGQVNLPGNFALPEGVDISDAIVQAKGPSGDATLRRVFLYRKGEIQNIDLSALRKGEEAPSVLLEDGDLVVVPRNERAFFVMGEARQPGRFLMPEDRELTAVDALAFAGGLGANGSFRRMSVLRTGPDGKLKEIQFNLDEFLKDAKVESNPVILPGDVLFVQSPKGINTAALIQIVSTTLLFDSILRR